MVSMGRFVREWPTTARPEWTIEIGLARRTVEV
jgi:hypothetical protein